MINLRRIDAADDTQTAGRLSTFSAPRFRVSDSVFGNFAEPLEYSAPLSDQTVGISCPPDEALGQESECGRRRDVENLESSLT